MNYSDKFLKALEFTLRWEGGYSNHPLDKGGSTNHGITQQVYDNYRKYKHRDNIPVKMIDMDEVREIYYNDYWIKAHCYSYPIKLAIAVFDFSVHSGVERALRYLDLVDSNLDMYLDQREQYFRTISKGSNKVFLKGWMSRLRAVRVFLSTLGD